MYRVPRYKMKRITASAGPRSKRPPRNALSPSVLFTVPPDLSIFGGEHPSSGQTNLLLSSRNGCARFQNGRRDRLKNGQRPRGAVSSGVTSDARRVTFLISSFCRFDGAPITLIAPRRYIVGSGPGEFSYTLDRCVYISETWRTIEINERTRRRSLEGIPLLREGGYREFIARIKLRGEMKSISVPMLFKWCLSVEETLMHSFHSRFTNVRRTRRVGELTAETRVTDYATDPEDLFYELVWTRSASRLCRFKSISLPRGLCIFLLPVNFLILSLDCMRTCFVIQFQQILHVNLILCR